MMKFYAHPTEDGRLRMSSEQTMSRWQFLPSFKPEDVIEETLKKYHQPKSRKQLGAWFGLFCKIVLAEFDDRGWDTSYIFRLDKPTGIGISVDLLKEFMYAMRPAYNDAGDRITIRNMDTTKMAQFFDDCRNWAASQWSITVPEPDPRWREKIQNEHN